MTDTLPNFDRSLGFVVSDISRLLRKSFERKVRGYGLTRAQWLLLYHAARQPGASQSDLAEALQLEKITISRHAARLERGGWLARSDHAQDGRAYRVQLTAKATGLIGQLSGAVDELTEEAMAGLPAARRHALIDDLLRIKANLAEIDLLSKPPSRSHDQAKPPP
jgi:hypothetical protein